MSILSAKQALKECVQPIDLARTGFVFSSTKGNIEWLGQVPDERIKLSESATIIAKELGINASPTIVAHACVSGVVALIYALRLLQAGQYENVVITGADRFTRFVLNGFQSFQAITSEPCRPFDADRKGLNLGEAAATIILSTNAGDAPLATLYSGATSNDANHISGPSRTGAELGDAITRALREASISSSAIDMISAHGTATLYNDEMEAKAFAGAGLLQANVHSMKGYTGHTLGAAGVLESAMIIEAIKNQQLIPSLGFETLGVSEPINVTKEMETASINYALKTASGFGGCNAAVLWGKV
jgi:3-oxoacyl-[acyl-carrier-protein] synthase-1